MIELTPDNLVNYLRERGWLGSEPTEVWPLGGGVSNAVLAVRTPERHFVVKQSRPQLRTRDAWFSDLERVYREQQVMELLHPLLPLSVPQVLHNDRANFVFAMSHAPADARVWKEMLLAGWKNPAIGVFAGQLLGRMHQATAERAAALLDLRDHEVFVQLRVDPFYRRVQERRPEVADAVADLIDQLLSIKEALCHGDFTPKNLLVHREGSLTLVDYETAHLGDPTMDLGLFQAHLLLKAIRQPEHFDYFASLLRCFWCGYAWEVRFRPLIELQNRGIAHTAVCLLARIDGTSPVDYLPQESRRELVRDLARYLLRERPSNWDEVLNWLHAAQKAREPHASR